MLPSHFLNYDAKGDWHYDLISAFIKSVRGSDPDAALYYLAWMLAGGEEPLFIARRLLILASEDVGLANSRALIFAQAAYQAVKEIGMPEARIILAEAAIYLASSPKSNSAYLAIEKALSRVRAGKSREPVIPFHLRNSPTNFMKDLGYGKNYHYPHDHEHHFIYEKYLPEEVAQEEFYQPTTMGAEKSLAEYLAFLWPGRFGPR
jgi:putative ATPase